MKFYSGPELNQIFDFPSLIEALRVGFTEEFLVPERMHIDYHNPHDGSENTLLLMPAIRIGDVSGVKLVNVAPANSTRGMASIQGVYYLMNSTTGQPMAIMDAKSLTNWRTAAASALAASYLADPESQRLLMVGTGSLAPFLIEAHLVNRPIDELMVYGRSAAKAEALGQRFSGRLKKVSVEMDLEEAVRRADIISVATFSSTALIKGRWLRPGQHLDLVGSFKPNMREADDEVMRRSAIYVDVKQTAPRESGDLAIPMAHGVISEKDIKGDLFQLCRGEIPGRSSSQETTLFKSVGHALEDLVAARLIIQKIQ